MFKLSPSLGITREDDVDSYFSQTTGWTLIIIASCLGFEFHLHKSPASHKRTCKWYSGKENEKNGEKLKLTRP